jgi:hypothetical protein
MEGVLAVEMNYSSCTKVGSLRIKYEVWEERGSKSAGSEESETDVLNVALLV